MNANNTSPKNASDSSDTSLDIRFNKIDERFDELMSALSKFSDGVDVRFSKIETKLESHDEEFRKINAKYDHLVNSIDGFISRIDTYVTELAARDHKIARLERWIEDIAKKTGVPMPS